MPDVSVIHDIGYQRYDGPRLGRAHVVQAMYVHALRAAFGLGRTAKAKIFPWLAVGIVCSIAVIVAAVRAQLGVSIMSYGEFVENASWIVILFAAVVAPELVSRDIGSGVLPLYFSRPVSATDYLVAKLAACVTAVWLLLGGPQLLMFLTAAFTTDKGMPGVWREWLDWLPGLGYGLIWAVLFAVISVLVASLTGKRAFAAGSIVAVFLLTRAVVGVLGVAPTATVRQLAGLGSPTTLLRGVGSWLLQNRVGGFPVGSYGRVYGVVLIALVAAGTTLLIIRYRKVAAR